MFTGIISAVSKVTDTVHAKDVGKTGDFRVSFARPRGWKLAQGESVSVDGICSTVRGLTGTTFSVDYMPETLRVTTAAEFLKGRAVNLERPLRLGDRLDGHLVQGHVDAVGTVLGIRRDGAASIVKVGFPSPYRKFIAKKGSIAMNGASLTVVTTGKTGGKGWFTVSLVDYTLRHTALRDLGKGDMVNLEVDMLARYLAALVGAAKGRQ